MTGAIGSSNVPINEHDLQLMPNGDYLGIEYVTTNCSTGPSACVDLTSWNRSSTSSFTDNVVVEITPQGHVVWSWDLAKHVDIATANTAWRSQYPDVFHMNSVAYDGHGGVIISCRHLDAVYRINMTNGGITWKLGGNTTSKSLRVVGDTNSQLFSGQHAAEILPNDQVTVYDDGSRATPSRPARAVRFTIDTTAMTATEDESVSDARAITSPYEGNTEKLPGGNWVSNWAASGLISEINPSGAPQLSILIPGIIPYRVVDVPVAVPALRAGMNAMVPLLTDVPTATIITPTPQSSIKGSNVMLNASDTDPGRATQATYLLTAGALTDHVIAQSLGSPFGWIAFVNTTTIANGTYTLECKITNAAGNSALSTPVTITIDNPPPVAPTTH